MRSQAEQTLRTVLREEFPNAAQEIAPVAGGFVVALISPLFGLFPDAPFSEADAAQRVVERIWRENARLEQTDRVVIFELKFFPSELAAFSERAHLRARPTSWENGHPVVTTTAQDAFVLAHRVDAEALLIDPLSKQECRVVQDQSELPGFRVGARRFAQLDLAGSSFPVRDVEPGQSPAWLVHFT